MAGMIKRFVVFSYVLFYVLLLLIGGSMIIFDSPVVKTPLIVLSSWTSTCIFILMFRKIYPGKSLWQFIKSRFTERISIPVILYALLLQSAILAGTLIITSLLPNVPIHKQVTSSWTTLILLFGYHLIQGPLGEELGWRGFVLNELQMRFSPLKSAILVGLAWGLWHAPLWLMSGYSGLPLLQYVICFLSCIVALSIIITACYNLNHNLVIPILIHQLFNYFIAIQAGDLLQILTVTAVLYIFAAGIVVWMNPDVLSKQNPRTEFSAGGNGT
ncbi:CPBP family intramembrane glutamic endopeptidase [Paenibacillus tepidiphilus]|uniref:CPBP family intramembrane glutamic endopeptidase n=1 Tax=Paenibacillus tepidiphilus TaxID=2608683 RepID=UPI0013A56A8C|nr:CPBP family intramembrane glutamic endopeptidase [Paenibacillus tepidiphilus]